SRLRKRSLRHPLLKPRTLESWNAEVVREPTGLTRRAPTESEGCSPRVVKRQIRKPLALDSCDLKQTFSTRSYLAGTNTAKTLKSLLLHEASVTAQDSTFWAGSHPVRKGFHFGTTRPPSLYDLNV